jgi:hypothetical protein
MRRNRAATLIALAVVCASFFVSAEEEPASVPFDDERWQLGRARVIEVDGRQAVAGTAFANHIDLADGFLEVDVKVESREARSYPGFIFRMASPADAERVYLRPHRAPLYDDATQYAAVYNGIAGWQLYAGDGATASTSIPVGQWFTLRLEMAGDRARLLLDGNEILLVDHLRHGARGGGVGLIGPANGAAVFSNFRWAAVEDLDLGPSTPSIDPPGVFARWQISSPIEYADVDSARLPDLEGLTWTEAVSEPDGLVDIARFVAPDVAGPPTVVARTTLHVDEPRTVPLQLGYSDRLTVFVDGKPVYNGVSDYRLRDSGFLGVVGPFDTVYLDLSEGDHELALQVTETFGGWGFMCRDGSATARAEGVDGLWRTGGFEVPESVLYDPEREVAYVSNNDGFRLGGEGRQHLSRIGLDGSVMDRVWVEGLTNPTGLAWRGQEILVVERRSVAVIDPETATVTGRIPVPEGRLLNDIAVAPGGTAYVSDSRASLVYRITADGEVEKWLQTGPGRNPNGVCVVGNRLMVGLNPVHMLASADLEEGNLEDFAVLPSGLIDGIEEFGDGTLLVSQGEGRLLRVGPDGEIEVVVDDSNLDHPFADIDVSSERDLVLVPSYYTGTVAAFSLQP